MADIRARWAAKDAFIGPHLPSAVSGIWETREDREVFCLTGRWWAKPLGAVGAQGPFATILEARRAPLDQDVARWPGEAV